MVEGEFFPDEGQTTRTLSPDECAALLLEGVQVDHDPRLGTVAFFDGLRTVVTDLCIAAGVEQVTKDTSVLSLITRANELQGTEIPEDLQAMAEDLAKPLDGDVLTVSRRIGIGEGRPLSMYVQGLTIRFSSDQDVLSISDEI